MTDTQMDELQRTMLHQAYLFDDPHSYRCGVQDTLDVMRQILVETRQGVPRSGVTPTTRAS